MEVFMPIFLMLLLTSLSYAKVAERPLVKTINDKDIKWGPCPELFPKGCEIGVLHGDPKKKETDVYFRVPANYSIPAHSHTSAEHMTLVSGNLEVKYKGENLMHLNEGSYAYGPAELPHQAKCISQEPCVLFISFDEPIDAKAYTGTL